MNDIENTCRIHIQKKIFFRTFKIMYLISEVLFT